MNPHRPALPALKKEASFIVPPVLQLAPYPGSPRQSDRGTIEGPLSVPKASHPGSGMPGEPWEHVNAPSRSGLRRR